MFAPLDSIAEQPDTPATLWRFMDFTKYVAMLHQRALFFARADQMPDPFEGLYGQRARLPRRAAGAGGDLRQRVFLSCWHENQHESAAMWRMYLSAEDGVAVCTSVARLRAGLAGAGETIHVGRVRYVDGADQARPPDHALGPFFWKKSSFEFEREVRLLWHSDGPTDELGRYIPADLQRVIEQVVVSPTGEPWLRDLVASVTDKYGLDLPVVASSMLEAP